MSWLDDQPPELAYKITLDDNIDQAWKTTIDYILVGETFYISTVNHGVNTISELICQLNN